MAKIYINNSGYTEVTKVGIKNSGSWIKNGNYIPVDSKVLNK